jgi:hypothetical protein
VQQRERGVRVAASHRHRQRSDPATEAVPAVEHDDPVADRDAGRRIGRVHGDAARGLERAPRLRPDHHPLGGWPDDVAEHGARLDRGKLSRVTDEHEPRLRPERLEQPRHQRQGHHRRLVDDHDVVGEPLIAVVAKAAVAARPSAEQTVKRRPLQRQKLLANRVGDVEAGGLGVHRLL